MFKKKHDSAKPYYNYQIKMLQRKLMWKLINDEQPKIKKFSRKRGKAINNHNQNKFIVPFSITTVAISSLSYQ